MPHHYAFHSGRLGDRMITKADRTSLGTGEDTYACLALTSHSDNERDEVKDPVVVHRPGLMTTPSRVTNHRPSPTTPPLPPQIATRTEPSTASCMDANATLTPAKGKYTPRPAPPDGPALNDSDFLAEWRDGTDVADAHPLSAGLAQELASWNGINTPEPRNFARKPLSPVLR